MALRVARRGYYTGPYTTPELYRLTYRASDHDLLIAFIGGTPFRHIRPDSPAYSDLVRLTAPNWASQFKGVYT